MLTDSAGVAIFATSVLVALAVWRNALRPRAPRWAHVVSGLLLVEIVVGVIYTEYELNRTFAAVDADDAGNKATLLAQHISHAMWGNAIAVLGVLLAIVVLAIATVLARRRGDDAPVAKLH